MQQDLSQVIGVLGPKAHTESCRYNCGLCCHCQIISELVVNMWKRRGEEYSDTVWRSSAVAVVVRELLLKHFSYHSQPRHNNLMRLVFSQHMNQHEASGSCQAWCGWAPPLLRLIWFSCSCRSLLWCQVNHSSWVGEASCAAVTWLRPSEEWLSFAFSFSIISPCATDTHPPTRPSIRPPSRRLGGAGVISGCHFMRAIIKGSCLVSMETAHFRGGRSEEACARMLRVTMETGATAYISIQCVRPLHHGTFHHIINARSVCSLLLKITTMSFQMAGRLVGRTAAVKVRLISPPIKPSLCMEQLSTAISKVTHQMICFFPSKSHTWTLRPDVAPVCFINCTDDAPRGFFCAECRNKMHYPKCNGPIKGLGQERK